VPDHVDAESVDAFAEPKAHGIVDRLAQLRVAPVEVRLLLEKGVIVILSRRRIIFPGAAAEFRQPVIGRTAIGRCIAPDVPVALWVIARGAALREPGMAVGGMVRHEVEDDLQPEPVRRLEQRVEIGHAAEQGIDADVVGDVVAEIGHRGSEDRRQPYRIDAERGDIGQSLCDALEITNAVAVGILERARIDLVEDAVPPPGLIVVFHGGNRSLLSRVGQRRNGRSVHLEQGFGDIRVTA
jgi:hypothetical protein